MSTELARSLDFTAEQRQMILHTYAAGASPAEFAVLMEVAKARNLNPLTKQIWFVKLAGKWTFQVSIDGLRSIAQRSGLYAGQDPAAYQYDGKGGIVSCSVSVYRKDWQRPCVGTAFFKEYSTGQNLWASKPHTMIAKVAESIALRKAFSEEMSGLYAEGELDQSIVAAPAQSRPARVVSIAPVVEQPVSQHQDEEPPPPGDDYAPEDLAVFDAGTGEVVSEPQTVSDVRLPFGKSKGKLLSEAGLSDLTWVAGALAKSIADPAKANFIASNQELLAAVKAELARRGGK